MLKTSACMFVATTFSLTLAGAAQAAPPTDGEATARQGVVTCGFNNRLRLSGAEVLVTFLNLRNVDPAEPIFIDRMRFFDAQGAVLFDSAVSGGLPNSTSGIWGPTNNVLNPYQTAQWDSSAFLPLLDAAHRPGQAEIQWSAGRRGALTLGASTTGVSRERNVTTGAQLVERGRTSSACRSIFLR